MSLDLSWRDCRLLSTALQEYIAKMKRDIASPAITEDEYSELANDIMYLECLLGGMEAHLKQLEAT